MEHVFAAVESFGSGWDWGPNSRGVGLVGSCHEQEYYYNQGQDADHPKSVLYKYSSSLKILSRTLCPTHWDRS